MISLGMNSYITTQGFARTGMCTVLIGAILNIIFDAFFINYLHMGVKGAAIATIIAQGIVLHLGPFLFIWKKEPVKDAAGIFQGEEEGASAHHGSGCIALYHEHYRKPDPDLL